MKKALRILTISYMTFLFLLTLSGFFEGALSYVIYYASFLLAVLIGYLLSERRVNIKDAFLLPSRDGVSMLALSVFPFLAVMMALSYLTSLVLVLFGFSSPEVDVSGNIFLVLFEHALVPAFLEEMLFRFLPFALLLPHSKRAAVIFSAVFFALMHCSLFQIPYAFVAGVALGLLYLASGSIIPSFILHLINNIFSVFWIKYGGVQSFATYSMISIAVLAIISLVIMTVLKRRTVITLIKDVFNTESKLVFTYEPVILMLLTVFIAISNLVSR